jgi:hypothetical protein
VSSSEEKDKQITRVQNLVVARYRDGKMVKGMTYDFGPQKKLFHLITTGANSEQVSTEILLSELKAVFFVKSLEGRKGPPSVKGLLEEEEKIEIGSARKLKITFFDGETLLGTTLGYNPEREGFFIAPLEKDSNNLRIFVISGAVKQIEILK